MAMGGVWLIRSQMLYPLGYGGLRVLYTDCCRIFTMRYLILACYNCPLEGAMQTRITTAGKLLDPSGRLTQVGWSPQPLLDCNLENAGFYKLRAFQCFRIKRWDYYAIFTPRSFFSATIADLGYAGNLFVYVLNFETGELHEEGIVVPLGKGIRLPRNSQGGDSSFEDQHARLHFNQTPNGRHISVDWPAFHAGRGIAAEIDLRLDPAHESMVIVIPIGKKRFYYNRKINCLPASGSVRYGSMDEKLTENDCLGSLDWGRGVWEYKSFWNWASASGFLPDGRTIGLNFGKGFGDLSAATENCIVLNGKVNKLEKVEFAYSAQNYMQPWKFTDSEGCLSLDFIPFKERLARTNLGIITSEVHQMFGRYSGTIVTDTGDRLDFRDLIGFAEQHQARW